jgi:hypothetical protein
MDAAAFREAVQGMHGFSPDTVQYLVSLSESLTDKERDALVGDLKPLNDKAGENLAQQESLGEQAQTAVAMVQREVMQKQEGSQRSSDLRQAESNLTSL